MSDVLHRVVGCHDELIGSVGGYCTVLGEDLSLAKSQELVKANISNFLGGCWPEYMTAIKPSDDEIQERINNLKES